MVAPCGRIINWRQRRLNSLACGNAIQQSNGKRIVTPIRAHRYVISFVPNETMYRDFSPEPQPDCAGQKGNPVTLIIKLIAP